MTSKKQPQSETSSDSDSDVKDKEPSWRQKKFQITQFNPETGDAIKDFTSMGQAAKELGLQTYHIYGCCKGLKKSYQGFGFRYSYPEAQICKKTTKEEQKAKKNIADQEEERKAYEEAVKQRLKEAKEKFLNE